MRSSKYTWDIDKREKEADWKRVWWFWTSLTMVHTTYLYKSRLCHPKCQIYMARYIPYGNIKCFQAIGKVLKYFTFHQIIKNHEDQKGYRITQYYIITALINSTMCKVVYIIRCYVHQKISFSYFYYKTQEPMVKDQISN